MVFSELLQIQLSNAPPKIMLRYMYIGVARRHLSDNYHLELIDMYQIWYADVGCIIPLVDVRPLL